MEEIVKEFLSQTEQAIQTKDFNRWLEIFPWDDDVYIEAQKNWFTSKFIDRNVDRIHMDILQQEINHKNIFVKTLMFLEYEDGQNEEETYLFKLECADDLRDWSVVGYEKERKQFGSGDFDVNKEIYFDKKTIGDQYKWWMDSELINQVKGSLDPESSGFYARAVSRNIRFREAHPILESAAVLSNMMSLRLCKYIFNLFDHDNYKLLVNVYNAFKNSFQVKLIRDDRDNTWNSKYVAPWYGFDELFNMRDENGIIYGSCNSYMTFMTSLLRLGGYDDKNLFQMRLGNQDIVLIKGKEDYLLTSDGLESINENTSYYKKDVDKVFNDQWYFTNNGDLNIDDDEADSICKSIEEKIPFLNFHPINRHNVKNERLGLSVPSLDEFYSTDELCRYLKKKVICLSKKNPYSVYTWAKYAYQTIYVTKPEAYASWSVQNGMTRNFLDVIETEKELVEYILKLKDTSVFLEDDRIMTADQVIRHGKAGGKDRALFMFAWYRFKKCHSGAVFLTDKGNYVAYKGEEDWIVWNTDSMRRVDSISFDSTYICFDDKRSLCSFNENQYKDGIDIEWADLLNIKR